MYQVPLRQALAPLGAMLAIGLIAGYLDVRAPLRTDTSADPAPQRIATAVHRPSDSEAADPLTTPPGYRFLLLQPDHRTPIRWNPCHPVHYRVSTNGLVPTSEIARVRSTFDVAGRALGGMSFVYDGTTDVIPNVVDDAGKAGVDIVFAFAQTGHGPLGSALLTGWEAGRGGYAASGPADADGGSAERPTHGSVVVDVDKWRAMSPHDQAILYLHEIGHVVGLDHPRGLREIMTSGAYDLPVRYQSGDLAGLAKLGRQAGCMS